MAVKGLERRLNLRVKKISKHIEKNNYKLIKIRKKLLDEVVHEYKQNSPIKVNLGTDDYKQIDYSIKSILDWYICIESKGYTNKQKALMGTFYNLPSA